MKLYKELELHGAPKSHVTFTRRYILANNDEEAFTKIGKWDEEFWEEKAEDGYNYDMTKEEIMKQKGDLESEDGWEDAYYGIEKNGWEEVGEITEDEIAVLIKLKIIKG